MQGVELGQLELAYAITVHKAQGGEARHVVLALSPLHGRMLTRRLLYTGGWVGGWQGRSTSGSRAPALRSTRLCVLSCLAGLPCPGGPAGAQPWCEP